MCRLSSREKTSLQDLSKERRPGGAGGPPIGDGDDDEREEGPTGEGLRGWFPGSEGGGAGSQRHLACSSHGSGFLTH